MTPPHSIVIPVFHLSFPSFQGRTGIQCLVAEIGVIPFVGGDPSPSLRVTDHINIILTYCPLCHSERSEESRLLRLLVPPGTRRCCPFQLALDSHVRGNDNGCRGASRSALNQPWAISYQLWTMRPQGKALGLDNRKSDIT